MNANGVKKKTLLDYGYKFNSEGNKAKFKIAESILLCQFSGQLREVDEDGNTTEEGFRFDVHEKKADNQRRYEEIGKIMDREVYSLLETVGGLERVEVGPEEPRSFIFCSPGTRTKERVVMLIHGSGVVRAGQWARRLIINEVCHVISKSCDDLCYLSCNLNIYKMTCVICNTFSTSQITYVICRTSLKAPCFPTSNTSIPAAGA